MARVRLGGMRDTGGSATVYRTANAFEIDELEGTDGVRRRIFFEDEGANAHRVSAGVVKRF